VSTGGIVQQAEAMTSNGNRMRADELAARAGITVQLLRSYQSKGLVPPPRHEGRLAWYDRRHLDRLAQIRDLKARGYSLRMIASTLLEGDDFPPPAAAPDERRFLSLREVAEQAQVPPELIRALEASGLLQPFQVGHAWLFTEHDVRFVRHVLTLLGVGLPLDVFLEIATPFTQAGSGLTKTTVVAWDDLVASHLRASTLPRDEMGSRVAASAQALATIVGELVGYYVERSVLQAVQAHLAEAGSAAEQQAFADQLRPAKPEVE
jgi:DNA-binding transcriptional MerR regulator